MASEAGWQIGGSNKNGDEPMDQRAVESLLRRLVERVEESERRYGEALEELHSRLDQLSQTTSTARTTSAPEEAKTFDRLHSRVSDLARRLEQEATTQSSLDDFERIGQALSRDLGYSAEPGPARDTKPQASPYSQPEREPAPYPSWPIDDEAPGAPAEPVFSFPLPETAYNPPAIEAYAPPADETDERELDRRLVDMAHRLEHSLGTSMPVAAIEALNARLEEIGAQLNDALAGTAKRENLEHVEKQLAELGQQLGRAEVQLARMGSIETQLLKLIERVDAGPADLEAVASKAAAEAVKLATGDGKSGAAERIDAMHRDLAARSDRARANDERLSTTLTAVHDSLKQLVQLAERAAAAQPIVSQAPLAESVREQQAVGSQTALRARNVDAAAEGSPRNRAGAATADFQEPEPAPFGRSRRAHVADDAFDLDTPQPRRAKAATQTDAEYEAPDDLVAAARRAAQAAAARADERHGARGRKTVQAAQGSGSAIEGFVRNKRSLLIVSAAILLTLSAALLYGRLKSKPAYEAAPPAIEQSVPAPDAIHGTPAPDTTQSLQDPYESEPASPEAEPSDPAAEPAAPEAAPDKSGTDAAPDEQSGSWAPTVTPEEENSGEEQPSQTGQATGGFTEIAKSTHHAPVSQAGELTLAPQPASLKRGEPAALPAGVVFSVEEPTLGGDAGAAVPAGAGAALAAPTQASLPLPPDEIGPLPLRQAAAAGDPRAQYLVALRYAKDGTKPGYMEEAAHWLERAAAAGLAPAQYRLGAMYERGDGVAQDRGRARSWYQAAAEKGNVKAMHNLAVGVSGAQGSGADYALAAKWYGEAASYGLGDSQYNLGILAEHGLGMPKNLPEAYQWFALAAKNGDTEAAKRRDAVKAALDAQSLAAAEQAVNSWKARDFIPDANEIDEPAEWADASAVAPNSMLVSRAQAALNKLGYAIGKPDGVLGDKTRAAIKSFELKNGLDETGQVTVPLVSQLERLAG